MRNSIFTLYPYCKGGVWMFDDKLIGVKEEAFVSGADTLIEKLTAAFAVRDPKRGFILQFSDKAFPDAQVTLFKKGRGGRNTGTWYMLPIPGKVGAFLEGWLCPVLNMYYPRSPKELHVAVKSRRS
jgi:hypothetical protein